MHVTNTVHCNFLCKLLPCWCFPVSLFVFLCWEFHIIFQFGFIAAARVLLLSEYYCCQSITAVRILLLSEYKRCQSINAVRVLLLPEYWCCQNITAVRILMLSEYCCCQNINAVRILLLSEYYCCQNIMFSSCLFQVKSFNGKLFRLSTSFILKTANFI